MEGKGLRIVLIGQSAFAADVLERLTQEGHQICAVFTIPDKGKREDALAKAARLNDIPVHKVATWRRKGQLIPEVFELYKSVAGDLNVLPYCSQFLPMEVIDYPKHKTIIYHPSLLPRHRGASAINWTLIQGDADCGYTVFWADDGLDTGPILLQEACAVRVDDTVDTLYKRFLYPNGVEGVVRAVGLISGGKAPSVTQDEASATYDAMLTPAKRDLLQVNWSQSPTEVYNFIRGLDSVPGACCRLLLPNAGTCDPDEVQLFGASLWRGGKPSEATIELKILNCDNWRAFVHSAGLLFLTAGDLGVNIKRVRVQGRIKDASALCATEERSKLTLSPQECEKIEVVRSIWEDILSLEIEDSTDFFAAGAASMDVVRLVEEVFEALNIQVEPEDLFLASVFEDFCTVVVKKARGAEVKEEIEYRAVEVEANRLRLRFPCQLFIDGRFEDAEGGRELPTVNPSDETVICQVQCASASDVDRAVLAAERAFYEGEWSKISARDRGQLLYKLADLMEEHKAELATLEALDSGAVYTLALKTHVGMSIQTFRYFAGWADKVQGSTVPIAHARPNRNMAFTRKEPIGVCGLVTPWNYPLMMVAWKLAACLAAGNTAVLKPAQVCPLTALKLAELTAKAGFPPGVYNVVPGKGSEAGQALADHPKVRKLGFTGSTEIGRVIMRSCAEANLKRTSLELGGKSPLVIFEDCDMEKAVKLAMQGVFFNKGENCIAAGRIFVQDSIHDEFVRKVVAETKKIAIGDPLNRSTSHGPQNHLAHLNKLLEYVRYGVEEGARLVHGGRRLPRPGLFFQPAIFTEVEDHMYIAKEESFGPIMIISRFDGDLDAVIRRANATEYGLASGVLTKDLARAMRFAEAIEAGTVFVNTYNKTDVAAPFGGFKQSGFGKDLGQEALNEYLKTKCVTIEY